MFSTSGDVQYIGGCSVHRGDIMSTLGDIISTSGGIMMNVGGYHEYIGGCSVHRRDIMSTSGDSDNGSNLSKVKSTVFSELVFCDLFLFAIL